MRILIIIGSFKIGGAERMSINTGEELEKIGYDVHYILQRPIFEIPNSIPKNKIHILRNKDRKDFLYKFNSLFIGIFKITKDLNPDVIVAFSRFSSFLACFTGHPKIIGRFDMNPYTLNRKQRFRATCVLNFPNVKRVVVPSSGMLKALSKPNKKFESKFRVIPNSIKNNSVDKKAIEDSAFLIENDMEYIVAMGRLSPQKNFRLLINGYSKSKIREKYKLVIIGDGTLRRDLEELVENLNLQSNVIFSGQLENPYPVIINSKFFVNTSQRESFCNVILEALTLSKTVIATDCDYGPADMIIDGKNGYLIKDNNLTELIQKLDKFSEDEFLIDEFSSNAKKSVEKFHIQSIVKHWVDLFSEIGVT